jgi:integrase
MKSSRPRGTIVARGTARWLVRVSLGQDTNGRRVRINRTVHGNKTDALRLLTMMLKGADDGFSITPNRETLGEWFNEWLGTWCREVSDRTLDDYRQLVRRYFPRTLLAKKLEAVTAADVQQLLNRLTDTGLAARTVRYVHATIRRALYVAMRQGRVARNVATLAKPPRLKRREMRAFDPASARLFLDAAQGTRYEALWHVLLTGGLRPAEAFGLRWLDVQDDKLRVQRSLVRVRGGDWRLLEPKSQRSRRVVVLPASAVRSLHWHRVRQAQERLKLGSDYHDANLVFANEFGGPLHLNNITVRHFKPLLRAAGLPDMRIYDLRHSAATLRLANGENPKVVAEMLGHASVVLTLDTYSHVLPDMQAASAARLEDMLFSEKVIA